MGYVGGGVKAPPLLLSISMSVVHAPYMNTLALLYLQESE